MIHDIVHRHNQSRAIPWIYIYLEPAFGLYISYLGLFISTIRQTHHVSKTSISWTVHIHNQTNSSCFQDLHILDRSHPQSDKLIMFLRPPYLGLFTPTISQTHHVSKTSISWTVYTHNQPNSSCFQDLHILDRSHPQSDKLIMFPRPPYLGPFTSTIRQTHHVSKTSISCTVYTHNQPNSSCFQDCFQDLCILDRSHPRNSSCLHSSYGIKVFILSHSICAYIMDISHPAVSGIPPPPDHDPSCPAALPSILSGYHSTLQYWRTRTVDGRPAPGSG